MRIVLIFSVYLKCSWRNALY